MTALQPNVLAELEYIRYWTQTRDTHLSPGQNTAKANWKLHSQYLYTNMLDHYTWIQSLVPLFIYWKTCPHT